MNQWLLYDTGIQITSKLEGSLKLSISTCVKFIIRVFSCCTVIICTRCLDAECEDTVPNKEFQDICFVQYYIITIIILWYLNVNI